MIDQAQTKEKPANSVDISNPQKQLYGEWTIVEVHGKAVETRDRAYIYLDFAGGNKFYGNNGCNAINGTFELHDKQISFSDMVSTMALCDNATSERTVMRALTSTRSYAVSELYKTYYLELCDNRGKTVMKLRRQNLDFLNGAWMVKEMGGANVLQKNIRLVVDIQMLTVTALTQCNIINGVVHIDPRKECDLQFEDLKSPHNACEGIDDETQLLINLEETTTCKRINDNEIGLMNHTGTIVLVLARLDLKKEHNF